MSLRIAVPIIERTTEEALNYMERVLKMAEKEDLPIEYIIELRLDCMERPDVKRLLRGFPLPKIATNRVKSEGGYFEGTEDERFGYLQEAAVLGAKYVDVELDYYREISRGPDTMLIVSHHNPSYTPENLQEIYRNIVEKGADIVKIATKANSAEDSSRMLDLISRAKSEGVQLIGLCMGELGLDTRVHGPLLGAYLTFAPLDKGKESAKGQPTVNELKEMWRKLKTDWH